MFAKNQDAMNVVKNYVLTTAVPSVTEQTKRYFNSVTSDIPTRYGALPATPGSLWPSEVDRTKARYFHAFLFMSGWARTIIESQSKVGSRRATDLIRDWEQLFPIDNIDVDGMAYHDETTAQRLNTVLSLLIAAEAVADKESLDYLKAFADKTSALLVREDFHSGKNNHGMFQDISLRNYSVLSEWANPSLRKEYLDVSCARLETYFSDAF
ncbi:hypothetical protein, partial [Glutamicibacter arilaitensis]|uniref:hypothetical protein n=1 Tax=Glutamicibacter arilaitensis TaxID=256701 RepID=UPI003FD55E05